MKKTSFNSSRRLFLSQSSKVSLSLGLGSSLAGSAFFSACQSPSDEAVDADLTTGFTQSDLAYDYSALEPTIDAETMEIHYTKHAASYANNLQEALGEEDVDSDKPLEEVLHNISNYSTKMRNNGGGHYNHELFWKLMSPDGGGNPQGELAEAINDEFGSYNEFVSKFEEAASDRFGSGWAWLVIDNNQLKIGSTPNQDNPLMDVSDLRGVPLLGLDVWEHAYYLKYQNERGEYISNWWNVVDWAKVRERFNALKNS